MSYIAIVIWAIQLLMPNVSVNIVPSVYPGACGGLSYHDHLDMSECSNLVEFADLADHELCHILTNTTSEDLDVPQLEWHGSTWLSCYNQRPVSMIVYGGNPPPMPFPWSN